MTRSFNSTIECPNCGFSHTVETAFERWIRNNPELDSRRTGIVRFDLDVLHHKYLRKIDKRGTRDIQCMMFIEVKTHVIRAKPGLLSDAQRDTLSLLNQVLRNRRTNLHQEKLGRHAKNRTPLCKARSLLLNKDVRLWLFGGHLLTLSQTSPEDSDVITWDYKEIEIGQLIRLMQFDIDPDTLRRIDWRRRYSAFLPKKTLYDPANIVSK